MIFQVVHILSTFHLINSRKLCTYIFLNWTIPSLFFFIFILSKLQFCIKIYQRLDSNSGPQVLEATVVPTEPKGLIRLILGYKNVVQLSWTLYLNALMIYIWSDSTSFVCQICHCIVKQKIENKQKIIKNCGT